MRNKQVDIQETTKSSKQGTHHALVVDSVDSSMELQQLADHDVLAVETGHMQRCVAVDIDRIHLHTQLQQQLHHTDLSTSCCCMEGSVHLDRRQSGTGVNTNTDDKKTCPRQRTTDIKLAIVGTMFQHPYLILKTMCSPYYKGENGQI